MNIAPGEEPGVNIIDPDMLEKTEAAQRYEELGTDKLIYLQRARSCARVTIPMMFPPQGHSSATTYYTPFQSVGAIGLNNLTSKIVLALFPPGDPFFKFALSPKAKATIKKETNNEADGKDTQTEIETGLGLAEREVTNELEQHGSRIAKTEAIQQVLLSGNALIEVKPNNKLIAHHLENYVVRRDVDGHPIEVITRQTLKRQSLPDEAQELLQRIEKTHPVQSQGPENSSADRAVSMEPGNVDLFTWAEIRGKGKQRKWHVCQELMGHKVPGTEATWPLDASGFIPLCWRRIQGEHYGRGFVEQYLGDLNSLEALCQTLIEGASIAGQVKFVVDETGLTSIEQLANSANGAFINGEVEDGKPKNVGVVQVDKQMDFNFLLQAVKDITERLNSAFLKVQSRDAERVTAEEIRQLAKELEAALGGAYAILSQEFQRPLVRRVVLNMQKAGALKHWPKDMVRAEVIAGLEGLGREQMVQRLTTLFQTLGTAFGPQSMTQLFNPGVAAQRFGLALGIDMDGLYKSDEQQQQEAQAAQTAEQQKTLGPHLVKAASDQAKDIRAHNPGIDSQPGGAMGAVQAQMSGQHTAGAAAPPPAQR
jgi:hypothetical protein